jgi:phosphohistidine swiveling domain-containing protein
MSEKAAVSPKWGSVELTPLPQRFNAAMRSIASTRSADAGEEWSKLVFDHEAELFSRADADAIEKEALDSGYLFEFSANISLESEPDKYKRGAKPLPVDDFDAVTVDGHRLVGSGDNVILKTKPVRGTVAMITSTDEVMEFLMSGVPENTIAVIDDSGGTLTAPILEGFAGVICLGGTVRSHLGILAREYDVPTLMNCHISALATGDLVEIETTAAPPASDAYSTGDTGHARIWKLEGAN